MDLEGKTCGMCEKGKLHRIQHEAEPGIFVEAFQCEACREIEFTEAIVRKLQAMRRGASHMRSLIKVGSSLALSIPKEIVDKLHLKPKEKVYVTTKGNQIIAHVGQA